MNGSKDTRVNVKDRLEVSQVVRVYSLELVIVLLATEAVIGVEEGACLLHFLHDPAYLGVAVYRFMLLVYKLPKSRLTDWISEINCLLVEICSSRRLMLDLTLKESGSIAF